MYRLGIVSKQYFTGGLKPVSWRQPYPLFRCGFSLFGLHEKPLFINASFPRTYKSRHKKEIKQR